MSDPILPLAVWEEGTLQNDVPANDNALRVEAISREVLGTENSPTLTVDGAVFIVGPAPTGAFSTFDPDDLTIHYGGTWYAWAPVDGVIVNLEGSLVQFAGSSGWVPFSGAGMTNPMTTAGDIIIGGSGGTPTRLAAGTNTYVLTMVAGAPAWAVGGGAGLTNWTDGLNSSSPNATIPVASLAATNAATNVDAAFVPKGTGAVTAQIPDGTSAGGNKRGARSVDFQRTRTLATEVASGTDSFLGNGARNTLTGTYAAIVCGYGNSNAGGYSFIGAGESNTIGSGASARHVIGGGYTNSIGNSGAMDFIGGGQSNSIGASSTYCGILSGLSNAISASVSYGQITGGQGNTVGGEGSRAGGQYAADRGQIGVDAFASGRFSATGDTQVRRHHLRSDTTNATPEALTANNAAASATNQVVLPNNSAYNFEGKVVVRENATGDCASYKFEGTIRRGANAAATALVAAVTPVVVSADAGAATWAVAVSADTTNGTLAITVTGEASHNLKWTGFVETVEVVG